MPFLEPTNDSRANDAQKALDAFTEQQRGRYSDEPLTDRIADLICNLLHLAERDGNEGEKLEGKPDWGFRTVDLLDRARSNFEAETGDDDPDPEVSELCECGRAKDDCNTADDADGNHSDRGTLDAISHLHAAARHYLDKADDPGHGPDSNCETCRYHLAHA